MTGGGYVGKAPSRSVVVGMVAVLVLALTLLGTLKDLPQEMRVTAQALGTLSGIYLGSLWQAHDQRRTAEGAAKSSISHLVALAKGLQALIDLLDKVTQRLRETPPKSIDAYQNAVESALSGIDAQSRGFLAQANAAAEAWYPFLRENDPFMQELRNRTGQPAQQGESEEGSKA
jgi:hypothetical protein